MSYKDFLQVRIKELEQRIENATDEKTTLQDALNKLRLAEFEEDLRSDGNQQLLKG